MGGIVNLPIPLIHIHDTHHKLHIPGCMDSVRCLIKFRHIKTQFFNGIRTFLVCDISFSFSKKEQYQLILIHFRCNLAACLQKIFNVLVGSITAYCLERFEFRFKKIIYILFYLAMMVPTNIVEIARFQVIRGMGLYNTLGAPIVIYIAANLMQLYIYRQFISGISVSLDESAMLDGCGYFRIFAQIIFPLLTPATATLVIIKTVSIVNDMYIPYLYMPKNQNKTLTTFLMRYAGAQQNSWPLLAAGIIVVALPTVLLYIFFQKYIIEGITAGAVKE